MRSTSTPFVAAAIKLLIFLLQKLGGRQFECSAKYRTGSEYPSLTIQTDIPVFDGHDLHASTGTENQQLFLSTTAAHKLSARYQLSIIFNRKEEDSHAKSKSVLMPSLLVSGCRISKCGRRKCSAMFRRRSFMLSYYLT